MIAAPSVALTAPLVNRLQTLQSHGRCSRAVPSKHCATQKRSDRRAHLCRDWCLVCQSPICVLFWAAKCAATSGAATAPREMLASVRWIPPCKAGVTVCVYVLCKENTMARVL